ncbi:MAG: T9SS type A sorting domain-containing protein [Gemmatimonadetes bacterium]|nr:T9SS type A sorting domain-containing protein [Gemmatimonadota bacterium]MBT7862439.1 T9SS type A sorting domain-containing protein [Gemmatimonadota bacterium]
MSRRHYPWFLLSGISVLCAAQIVEADPRPLRDDISVKMITSVGRNIFRIAKDPRDNTLYIQANNGTISRIDIKDPGDQIGEQIARGRVDGSVRVWDIIEPAQAVPDSVPLEAIRQADADGATRATDPTDGAGYALSSSNGSIVALPRTPVATREEYGLPFARALFIGADGTFYVTLDLDQANATSATVVATSADHGFSDVQGFDIDRNGTFFIGAITRDGGRVNNIARGDLDPATNERRWRIVAVTEPIPPGTKNHPHPGIVLSPDDRFVFLNSGSRTDHGEVAPADGYPEGTREVPLASAILRVPADGDGIVIPADGQALAASGYLFADGFRNAFDMAFSPDGDLFAADNGPDSDLPDALMWVREGHHFGFPWRMGGIDNPQQFGGYDPSVDNYILFTQSGARSDGLFHSDPTFPPPPARLSDPVINLGPDADRLRDPVTGGVIDASDAGASVMTFTPHSSPLGIIFDTKGVLIPEFRGDGFLLRTGGDCCDLINSFNDPDEDLLHLDLEKVGDNYQARITRIVEGFRGPMDAEIVDNRIYVIERSGPLGLWEITLPRGRMTAVESESSTTPRFEALDQNYPNPFNPTTTITYRLDAPGSVKLAVFDLAGQRIRRLVDAYRVAGVYVAEWDGNDDQGRRVASGVYLYRLQTATTTMSRRLTLLK